MEGSPIIKPLDVIEREHVLRVLRDLCGNRSHACKALGISIRTLRNKLSRYREAGFAVPPASPGTPCRCSAAAVSSPAG